MKNVSGVPNPAKGERSVVGTENLQSSLNPVPLNLPLGSFTEDSYLRGRPKFEIRARLRRLSDDVRWGRLRRVLIKGTVWYIPVRRQP
jgi:hypothetical protein